MNSGCKRVAYNLSARRISLTEGAYCEVDVIERMLPYIPGIAGRKDMCKARSRPARTLTLDLMSSHSPLSADTPVRVLVVDDHPIVRHGIAQLIDQQPGLEVGAQASSAADALSFAVKGNFDLAVIDVSLEGVSGLELIKQIRERGVETPILVMSMHDETFYAERALRAGAQGYVMKQRATTDILKAVRRVLEGELYLSSEMADQLLRRAVDGGSPERSGPAQLSDRELEVLQLLGQGVSTREIADQLHLSVKTIESYRANIKRKLDLKNATELMRYAVDWVRTEGAIDVDAD
jgi:DNA-binding NarL/FixJ family response regulator